MYELDHDFVCIQRHQKAEFLEFFQKGVENYIDGDWGNALGNFKAAQIQNPRDGPLQWIMAYITAANERNPEDWKGFRDLDLKQVVPEYNAAKDDSMDLDQDANPDDASMPGS